MSEKRFSQNLTPLGAWAFSIGTSIGWGSLVVTSNTYLAQAGPLGSVLGMLLGAAVMLVISRNYAYLIQCYPEAGGAYTYAKEVFGHDHGFLTAWFLSLTYLAILWANATSLPLFARYFIGNVFQFGRMYALFGYDIYLGEAILPIAAVALIACLCIRGKKLAARLMVALAFLFTAAITAVFALCILRLDRPLAPAYVPDSAAISQIVKIAVISPWAFIGFENISHGAEEFSFKRGKAFRIFVVTVCLTTLLYLFVTLLSVTAYPPQYSSWLEYIRDLNSLEGIDALPAFYAVRHYLGGAGVGLLMAALMALILTSLIGNMTALSRLFYAMGKDHILPRRFAEINAHGTPGNALWLTVCLSLLIPFLGRMAIGWIVDVTTIGATIIYAFVSASARKLAADRGDSTEKWTGAVGFVLMTLYLLCLLLPNLVSQGSMAKESYFLFIVWSILGFLFFRDILRRDEAHRFGRTVIVWVALLALVLFIALIWMRQSMISSNQTMMEHVREHYAAAGEAVQLRQADERFIEFEMSQLQKANTKTILMTTGMFIFALVIMLSNYSFMNRQNKESERIANTDPLTGVKSKHAYLTRERELDNEIDQRGHEAFSVVVCDINGLKSVNDTYGHKAGDDYIRAASHLICDIFQHSPVYRVGGDEFVAILFGRDHANRDALMRELNRRAEDSQDADRVIVSAGIAEYQPELDHSFHPVFERADQRMYQRKQELKAMGVQTR